MAGFHFFPSFTATSLYTPSRAGSPAEVIIRVPTP
jgi:hypothetical protein